MTASCQRNIYERALKAWGKESQADISVEECAELIFTLRKLERGQLDTQALVTEIADVEIALRQLRVIYGIPWPVIDVEIEKKLARLDERLRKEGF